MQIMFGTILCVLLKGLVLTKPTITPKNYTTSNILQEENDSMSPDLNFTQDISISEKNNHHILNFKSDQSHSDSTVRNKREVEDTLPGIYKIPELNDDTSNTPGTTKIKYHLLVTLSCIVSVIVTIICLYRLYRQCRSNNVQLSSTISGTELNILQARCQHTHFERTCSHTLRYNPDYTITKIARKQITFTKRIGSGSFGKVHKGKMKDLERSDTEISVAIKTLQPNACSHEKEQLLNEADLMNHCRHKHILRLLGVCLDGISPFLVLELMEPGDLLNYLRKCRKLEASDSHALRLQDLFAMCEDVARGCCYLEELRFVHRDLACRNCLVSSTNRENRVIKIGDFGLARDIYNKNYYHEKEERRHPIRWMAPESLMINIFNSQSDVWSFGILMWEITSLGEKPYVDKAIEEVKNYVRNGGRLPMTDNCPSALYQLMLRCWSGAADARPNFEFCLKNIIALKENIEDASLSPVDI